MILAGGVAPRPVEAGFFSWFDVISSARVEAGSNLAAVNSQKIGLEPSLGVNLGSGRGLGGGDNTIVSGSALLAESGPEGTLADLDDSPTTDEISVYVVRAGDSISQIAEMYGVSVNTIAWANDMSAKTPLKEGQILIILPVSGVRHTVARGETLASIAKKYKGDATEIAQFNGLESDEVKVGQVVIVPNGEVAPVTTTKPGAKSPVKGSTGPSYAGYYLRPLAGGVKTQGLHGYNGVDLASKAGTPILASAAGQVIISREGGWNGGYGNYVVISHSNGTQTLYAHLQSTAVAMGARVTQGQVIGYMGNTGRSTGTHLHFEIRGAKNPF